MSYANHIINAPVGIHDVQKALGVNLGGDLGRLCRSGKVNQWSKMKPVAFPYIEPDRTQAVSAYGKTLWWWKGHPTYETVAAGLTIGNYTTTAACAWITSCGVRFLGFTLPLDVLRALNPVGNIYHNGDSSPLANNFKYVPPTGGTAEPYRLVDFNYYKDNANYNIIPDYDTELGTAYVNANNPNAAKVECGIMCPQTSDIINSELSFNDLFNEVGDGNAHFTVVTGVLNGTTFDIVALSTSTTLNTSTFKTIELNLNASQAWGKTVIAIYCAALTIDGTTYYVPLLQSAGDHPNTTISYAPNRKCFRSWYVDNSVPYYAMEATAKQNYGSGFAWNTISTLSSLMTERLMNRLYLKLGMPRKSGTTYTFANNSIKVEIAGEFADANGNRNLVYYSLTSDMQRSGTVFSNGTTFGTGSIFVLKNSEVTDNWNWGTTETVTVTSGSGTAACYLAIYELFANRGGVDTTHGGTIWRIRIFFLDGQQDFSSEPDLVFGGLDEDSRLKINVDAVTT